MPKSGIIRLYLQTDLDAQWRELLNIYLTRASSAVWVDDRRDADFVVVKVFDLGGKGEDFFKGKRFIVMSPGDLPMGMLGLRPEDTVFREAIKRFGTELFYLQGEVEPKSAAEEASEDGFCSYKLDKLHTNENIHILSLPLGYCSGAKINVFYEDNDTSSYFTKTARKNPKQYDFDWCWIGAESSKDRSRLFEYLSCLNGKHKFVVSQLCKSKNRVERQKKLHADNKTVPYYKYLDLHRRSKCCVSANGLGMWNYKDGEFLANNCFTLRQYHKNLSLNPFTPQDGKHWAIFKTEDAHDAVKYYLENEGERERINDAGHEYFKWAITGGWAKEYAGMFSKYLEGDKHAFRKVEWVGKNA